ncbi:MAG TPA: ABC transporter permease [Blastocatellia bacterium]|nr:ABC transporter permease [Blastocatellia bacterium]
MNINKFIEAAAIALASIMAHKLRSFLTLLGVIIGVAVVTAVATVIEGANVYIKEKIATLGTGVFSLQKASLTGFGDFQKFFEAFRKNPDLGPEDVRVLREQVSLAEQIGAQDGGSRQIKYGNIALEGVGVQGVTPNLILLSNIEVEQGRYFGDFDDDNRREVCFLGADVVDGLFPSGDPIGKEIKIGSDSFTVVGVAKKLGSVLGQSQDNFVLLPLSTFVKTFAKRTSPTFQIKIRARSGVPIEAVQDQVRLVMRTRHKLNYNQPDDFAISTDEATEQLLGQITGTVGAVAFPVVGISLVIGGIVIMNIMLATVTERTREIGIRKSLGATRTDILVQFLVEAALLSGMGGLIGLLIAVSAMWVVGKYAPVPFAVPMWAPAIAIGISTLVGLFFGIYPANRAAKLDPIAALRAD